VRWPEDAARRDQCAQDGVRCLLVVAPGAAIPVVGDGEDWVYRSADERDVATRIDGLRRRSVGSRPRVVPVLPVGLSPEEQCVARRLLASPGRLVRRQDLFVHDLDEVVDSLAGRLAAVGWRISAVGPSGFLIDECEAGQR